MLNKQCIAYLLILFISNYNILFAQDVTDTFIKVFIDGEDSILEFAQDQLNFIHFVRNPEQADLHIQIMKQKTGNGGLEYTLAFIGRNDFRGMDDEFKCSFSENVTILEQNNQIIELMNAGLARYVFKSTDYKLFNINISSNGNSNHETIKDNWDNWVFSIGVDGAIEGEESKNEIKWEVDVDVDRITESSKIKSEGEYSTEIKEFDDDGETSRSSKYARAFDFLYTASISEHFSIGFFADAKSRTYDNIKLGYSIAPAIEYNIFPYSKSVRNYFTILYLLELKHYDYYETTIFLNDQDNLYGQALGLHYKIIEPWGEANLRLRASNYFYDFSKNRIELKSDLSFRLFGNFSLNVSAEYSYLNDQIYLPLEGATYEEILLNQKKISSQYEYDLKFGVKYSFGSIYNDIVNPRFE